MLTSDLIALADTVRSALAMADRLELTDVAIALDTALSRLVALDPSGTIVPVPYSLE